MAIKKEKFIQLSSPTVEIYNSIEQEMIENIATELGKDINILDSDPVAWKLKKLENMGMLTKQNINAIKTKSKLTSREINIALTQAGLDGVNLTEQEINKAVSKGAHLIKPIPIMESNKLNDILGHYQNQAREIANLTNQTLLPRGEQIYLDIVNKATGDVLAGNITGQVALRRSVSAITEQGITIVKDKAGRKRGLEGYIRSVLVTTSNNVVNEMQDARMDEWGIELTEISSHSGNRPGCVPYAGRIFSLKQNHYKYPYLYDPSVGRIGAADSLFGVNCGHHKYPYVEGVSVQRNFPNDPEKNKKDYDLSQKQRGIERSIRRAKNREKALNAMGDKKGVLQAQKLIKNRQATMRKFIKESKRTRRYGREQIFGPNSSDYKFKDLSKFKPKLPKVKTPKPKPEVFDPSKYSFINTNSKDVQEGIKQVRKLNNVEREAVYAYSGSAYDDMNRLTRGLATVDQVRSGTIEKVNELTRTIKKHSRPLSQDTILFRKMGYNATKDVLGDEANVIYRDVVDYKDSDKLKEMKVLLANKEVQDKAFMSTSHADNVFTKHNGITFEMHLPKGYNEGLFVQELSSFTTEYEYLMNKGLKWTIKDVRVGEVNDGGFGTSTNLILKVIPKLEKK